MGTLSVSFFVLCMVHTWLCVCVHFYSQTLKIMLQHCCLFWWSLSWFPIQTTVHLYSCSCQQIPMNRDHSRFPTMACNYTLSQSIYLLLVACICSFIIGKHQHKVWLRLRGTTHAVKSRFRPGGSSNAFKNGLRLRGTMHAVKKELWCLVLVLTIAWL